MAWNDPKPVRDGFGNVVKDGFGNPVMNTPGAAHPTDNERSSKSSSKTATTASNNKKTTTVMGENYYDINTGLYHYQGNTYTSGKDYSAAVKAFNEGKSGGGSTEWTKTDYGYDPDRVRISDKPNIREVMETLAGMSLTDLYSKYEYKEWGKIAKTASDIIHGVVGSNADTRDWKTIFESAKSDSGVGYDPKKFLALAGSATNKMYGGVKLKYKKAKKNNKGEVTQKSSVMIVDSQGNALRQLTRNKNEVARVLSSFGVEDVNKSLENIQAEMIADNDDIGLSSYGQVFTYFQDNVFEPWKNIEDIWNTENWTLMGEGTGTVDVTLDLEDTGGGAVGDTGGGTGGDTGGGTGGDTGDDTDGTGVDTGDTDIGTVGDDYTGIVDLPVDLPTYSDPTDTGITQIDPLDTLGSTEGDVGILPITDPSYDLETQFTGTTDVGTETGGAGAIPTTISIRPNYTGTNMANLTSQSQSGFGGQRKYKNKYGQELTVTVDGSGNPITYVPPGFSPVQGQAKGGVVSENDPEVQLARRFLGFDGPSHQLEKFLDSNPAAAARMGKYRQALSGSNLGFDEGGLADTDLADTTLEDFSGMAGDLVGQTTTPRQSTINLVTPETADFIGQDAGQAADVSPMQEVALAGTASQAVLPGTGTASTMTAGTVAPGVQAETDALQAQTGEVSDKAQVTAAQQETSAVSQLKAEQGTAIMMDNPVQREIQDGELISGAANASKAAEFTEQIEAATAEPSQKATVAGQLEGLMAQFEGGNTPAWAAGSMRQAMSKLAARGLGASSMAGQAVIQAAMEAALPIAQMDAQTQASFEAQNLSNRQQRAMLAAQQRATFMQQEFDQEFQARVQNASRIADVANMNFTAEQQIALENSRAANTMELNNLSNRQALVMAEAAALANLDMANLNNRQQAAVQNAQAFLQMDMANLTNEQATSMFKAQQNIQALFTDTAAENAAAQFNATSENQTNQFFANLNAQVSQFNASQKNAMDQFNLNSTNAMRQFNGNLQQQRDLFNAQNGLVVAQANAQWRQNIATLNQAAQNESNMDFAKTMNALTSTTLDAIWQRERDIMSFAFTSQQSALDRSLNLLLGDKKIAEVEKQLGAQKDAASTDLVFRFLFGSDPDGIFGGLFNKPS